MTALTAAEIYAKLDGPQKCELLDSADRKDPSPMMSWMHDLGLADADADYQGEETGYVDCSSVNELGLEVAKLCQVWYDARQEIVTGLDAMLTDVQTRLDGQVKQCAEGSKMYKEAKLCAYYESRVLRAVKDNIDLGQVWVAGCS